MDSLISILIFLGFVLLSILGQRAQKRQQEEEQKRRAEATSKVRDLPAKTRERIYGQGEIATAKPRQPTKPTVLESPREVLQEARPIELTDLWDALIGERKVQEETQKVEISMQQPTSIAERKPTERKLEKPVSKERPVVIHKKPPSSQQVKVERKKPVVIKPAPVAREVVQKEKKAFESGVAPYRKIRRGKEQAAVYPQRQLIRSLADLRYGIILSEILGPPKALRF